MITREDQKRLYESLLGDLVINTAPDGSGDDVSIEVQLHWGFEPTETDLPAIIVHELSKGRPIVRTMGDLWRSEDAGDFSGFIGETVLNIKIKAADVGTQDGGYIDKIDVANELYKRVFMTTFTKWDDLIEDGSVQEDGISPATDVSQITGIEAIKEYAMTIRLQSLFGGIPVETGPVLYSTAPTLLGVDSTIEFQEFTI